MFKLNLKIALRNLWKNKGYTFINVFGLSIGLASCILIFLFVRYQTSFDKDYANGDRIYRVVSSWKYADGQEDHSQGVPVPLASAFRNDFSQFEKVAAIIRSGATVKVKAAKGQVEVKKSEAVFYAEPEFFEIFDYTWLAGDPKKALNDPGTVVLSEKTANIYFGDWRKALGKRINVDNEKDFKVTGIIKDNPQNSSFPLHIVFSYPSYYSKYSKDWGSVSSSSECYVLLKKGVLLKDLEKPLQQHIEKYETDDEAPDKVSHALQALGEIHHSDVYGNFSEKNMPYKQLIGLCIIGLFLLLTACINFINLATAQAVSRSKEVGVRKVLGSRRKQLVGQFLSETGLITFTALLIACVLSELTIPKMESLFGGDVSFSLFGHPVIFIFLLVMFVVVGFLAGLYPALIMSGFSPALAIKNKVLASAGGVGLRKTLVVLQFTITTILIISTLVVAKQMSYIRNKPLGFDKNAIAMVNIPKDSLSQMKYNNFYERLKAIPGVKNVSFCSAAPSSGNNDETNFTYNNSVKADFQANVKAVDAAYFKTFALQFIAGRQITQSDTIKDYVVNETFAKRLNIKNAGEIIGMNLKIAGGTGQIVGVVKDFNNYSLHEKIAPIVMYSKKVRYSLIAVKIEPADIKSSIRQIESIFNSIFPEYVYKANFFDLDLQSFYETERIMGTLFKVFAGVVIFISFIGLFGLISFVATQRTREIAIRKVLGASNMEVIKMLNNSFLWMVLIANLIAWPVAYIFISKWLSEFEYRINLSIWPFVIAMFTSMSITIITVSLRSYRAARTNPVDALKYE